MKLFATGNAGSRGSNLRSVVFELGFQLFGAEAGELLDQELAGQLLDVAVVGCGGRPEGANHRIAASLSQLREHSPQSSAALTAGRFNQRGYTHLADVFVPDGRLRGAYSFGAAQGADRCAAFFL